MRVRIVNRNAIRLDVYLPTQGSSITLEPGVENGIYVNVTEEQYKKLLPYEQMNIKIEPTSEEPTSEEPTSEEPTSEEPTSEEPVEVLIGGKKVEDMAFKELQEVAKSLNISCGKASRKDLVNLINKELMGDEE